MASKNKSQPLNFVIPLVVYPFDVMVSIAEPNENLKKRLIKCGVNESEIDLDHSVTNRGRCVMFSGNQTLIRVYVRPETPAQYSHLQHEVFHAVQFIMDRIGMPLTYESGEAYAYLVGYLTEKIYQKCLNK